MSIYRIQMKEMVLPSLDLALVQSPFAEHTPSYGEVPRCRVLIVSLFDQTFRTNERKVAHAASFSLSDAWNIT